jgi:GntR family transcriptional repressor for pyruvate dehydrogenase complex
MTERAVPEHDESYRPGYSVAAERIIEHIDASGLQPGDRLPTEAEFAAMLGVSRTIARDALKTLAAVGRITTQRGRGIFVAETSQTFSPQLRGRFKPTNVDDIMMLFEFRAVQERAGAELAATRATPTELMAIEKAHTEYADHVPTRDIPALKRCDAEFHAAINAASHNPFIIEAALAGKALQSEVVEVAFGGYSGGPIEQALAEHNDIFNAIRRGDAAAAGAAAAAHVDRTRRSYEQEFGRRVFEKR